jgi:dihydrodipicolinate synthase/N-acetylneuraminate lyase
MRRLLAGVAVAAILISASARAVDFENGNQLYERCVEQGGFAPLKGYFGAVGMVKSPHVRNPMAAAETARAVDRQTLGRPRC